MNGRRKKCQTQKTSKEEVWSRPHWLTGAKTTKTTEKKSNLTITIQRNVFGSVSHCEDMWWLFDPLAVVITGRSTDKQIGKVREHGAEGREVNWAVFKAYVGVCVFVCVWVGSAPSCFLGNKTKSTDRSETTSTERKNERLAYCLTHWTRTAPLCVCQCVCVGPPCGFRTEKQSSHSTLAFGGSTEPASFHITPC